MPRDGRAAFAARHFDYDPRLRFEVPIEPAPPPAPGCARARPAQQRRGHAVVQPGRDGDAATPRGTAAALGRSGWRATPGGLFIPFRDATNGTETYGAGRYLVDAAKSADLGGDPATGTLVLDFNFAIQPSCAFDPRWACPLAPPENRLDLAIRAGERLA